MEDTGVILDGGIILEGAKYFDQDKKKYNLFFFFWLFQIVGAIILLNKFWI